MALGPGGRKILKSELVAAKYLAMTTPEVLADLLIDIGKQRLLVDNQHFRTRRGHPRAGFSASRPARPCAGFFCVG